MKKVLIFSHKEACTEAIRDMLQDYSAIYHDQPDASQLDTDASLVIVDFSLHENAKPLIQACNDQKTPCFLLSFENNQTLKSIILETGFSDFLQPPFNHSVNQAKIKTHINLAEMIRSFDAHTIPPDTHEEELLAAQDAAILCLAAVARVRDHSTGNHILRTQHYVKALAEHLRYHPAYSAELDNDDTIEIFYKTASLHDIGKVGIPDAILQKPGKLNREEYEIMKKHPVHGFNAIHTAELLLAREIKGKAASFLRIAQQVTLSHHEKWDGTGYPHGLKQQSIPIVARLMAVADVYDAIISKRPYKVALTHDTASAIIKKGSGTFFDPIVVAAFIDLESTFDKISYILEDYFPSQSDLSLHSFDDLIY